MKYFVSSIIVLLFFPHGLYAVAANEDSRDNPSIQQPPTSYLGISLGMPYKDVQNKIQRGPASSSNASPLLRLEDDSPYGYFDEPRRYILRASSLPYIRRAYFLFRETVPFERERDEASSPRLYGIVVRFGSEYFDFPQILKQLNSRYRGLKFVCTTHKPDKVTWKWPVKDSSACPTATGAYEMVLTQDRHGFGHVLHLFEVDGLKKQAHKIDFMRRMYRSDPYRDKILEGLTKP